MSSFVHFIAAAAGGPTPPGAGDYTLIDTISATAKPFIDAGPIVISRDGSTVFAVGQNAGALGLWVWRWDGASAWPNLQVIALGTPGDFTAVAEMPKMALACSEDGARVVLGMQDAVSMDGVVYVFDETLTDTWTQYQRLAPPASGGGDRFGTAVALTNDGSRLLVGEPGYYDGVQGLGRAHVYLDGGSSFSLEQTLADTSENGFGGLGSGVALSGDGSVAAVGNLSVLSPGFAGLGAIETYTRSGTTWTFEARGYPTEDDPMVGFARPGSLMCMDEDGVHILSADGLGVTADSVHYKRVGGALAFQSIVYGLGLSGSPSALYTAGMAMAGDGSTVVLGDYLYSTSRGRIRRWTGPTSWALGSNIDASSPTNNQQHARGVSTSRDGLIVVWSEAPTAANAATSLGDRAYLKVY